MQKHFDINFAPYAYEAAQRSASVALAVLANVNCKPELGGLVKVTTHLQLIQPFCREPDPAPFTRTLSRSPPAITTPLRQTVP